MLGHHALNFEEYISILKRRWWIIIIPAVILPILAVWISYRLTPVYTSQELVLIEQQKIPDSYVKPVVAEDLDSRLAMMKEQILSRSRLQPIIAKYNLGNLKTSMDDRIDQVRKDIQIKPVHSDISGSGGLPGFFVTFEAGDPHTAQAVCREITSLFLTENLQSREQSAEGTTEFLREQLNEAKSNLDAQDQKLADFQRENLGELPDDQGGNMNMLSTLSSQLDAATQAISQLQEQRSYLEGLLAQQGADSPITSAPGHPVQRAAAQPTPDQAKQLQALENQEADLTARYTPDYPDVIAVKRNIADLKKEIAQNGAVTGPTGTVVHTESPAVLQLRSHIAAIDDAIQEKRREQSQIQRQMGMYQGRVQSSPLVAAKYKELTRGYQSAQDFYDSLLAKMNQSQLGTALEQQQEGEQFRVMDDANLPDAPTFPKRPVFAFGGLAAGLALGVLIVAMIEYRDKSLRTERDVWAFTKLPTLGIIALNGTPQEPQPKWYKRWPKRAEPPLAKVGG